jgi:hypothetical protein
MSQPISRPLYMNMGSISSNLGSLHMHTTSQQARAAETRELLPHILLLLLLSVELLLSAKPFRLFAAAAGSQFWSLSESQSTVVLKKRVQTRPSTAHATYATYTSSAELPCPVTEEESPLRVDAIRPELTWVSWNANQNMPFSVPNIGILLPLSSLVYPSTHFTDKAFPFAVMYCP